MTPAGGWVRCCATPYNSVDSTVSWPVGHERNCGRARAYHVLRMSSRSQIAHGTPAPSDVQLTPVQMDVCAHLLPKGFNLASHAGPVPAPCSGHQNRHSYDIVRPPSLFVGYLTYLPVYPTTLGRQLTTRRDGGSVKAWYYATTKENNHGTLDARKQCGWVPD